MQAICFVVCALTEKQKPFKVLALTWQRSGFNPESQTLKGLVFINAATSTA